jgi:hypothetical protein
MTQSGSSGAAVNSTYLRESALGEDTIGSSVYIVGTDSKE